MQLSARELAAILNGSIEGDPDVKVNRPSKIEEGGEGSISFLGNPKYEDYVYQSTSSVLLVHRSFEPRQAVNATLIKVDDVYASVAILLEQFGKSTTRNTGISSQAFIHPSAVLAEEVTIEPFAVVEANAHIGKGSYIGPQVYIGQDVQVGNNTIIYAGVRIMQKTEIGDNCIIHPNVVIGSDGFGFAPNAEGIYQKIQHVGNVIIEDNVEIGANTTVDRATMGSTIIRQGAKLDNLIQVGHNVEIGENTVIAALVGIAGSTKIGKSCRIGGQVGFAGHLSVADGTQIGGQTGVMSTIKTPNANWVGTPAIPYKDYFRSFALFRQLPEIYQRLNELEALLRQQSNSTDTSSPTPPNN
ncbi:MAG: UDP-3-O-(3-hydroxymyristoyl)glucosamine N-acyltransferase [Saprospiraceae bacterium]|jgi:UDP-3-O-[3-hydroxymyristoyl] glucosamine N-acyltransferase|nr:UDP-3-O-(3-hydroxymyristoyl)glucosamine N-acyltransferase [Saprospiraceae bacterium]